MCQDPVISQILLSYQTGVRLEQREQRLRGICENKYEKKYCHEDTFWTQEKVVVGSNIKTASKTVCETSWEQDGIYQVKVWRIVTRMRTVWKAVGSAPTRKNHDPKLSQVFPIWLDASFPTHISRCFPLPLITSCLPLALPPPEFHTLFASMQRRTLCNLPISVCICHASQITRTSRISNLRPPRRQMHGQVHLAWCAPKKCFCPPFENSVTANRRPKKREQWKIHPGVKWPSSRK